MPIAPGVRLGPYEIVAPLGAGGMGEVWKGRDTRLDRDVAIKILPAGFARNEQLRARFEREAKSISSLNHPNICTLFDVGQCVLPGDDAVHYLVMELIEGESLADRLVRGPLPLDQVLKVGAQIGDALDRAHRQGIVHRDLKPGNVMLTKAGAKLLDFGLAHISIGAEPITSQTRLETQLKPLTAEGTILGTFQYMAPEQLEGLETDARTDIFALGAVLYEMATGRRAFQGSSRTSLIAAIISSQPEPISSITKVIPPALDHAVRKCLEKDRDDRWQSARDVAGQLRWIGESGSQPDAVSPVRIRGRRRERLAWAVAAVSLTSALALAAALTFQKAPAPGALRATIEPPPGRALLPFDFLGLALSPDGRELAFVASGSDTKRGIWIRKLSGMSSRPVPETDGASYPFWSPDGLHLGFFADGKLKTIDLRGGSPRVIAEAPSGRGGSWGRQGTILFAPNITAPIHKVPAEGGEAAPVTKYDEANHTTHRWPVFLPDGDHFLFLIRLRRTGRSEVGRLMLASVGSREETVLIDDSTNALYVEPGYLLFGRGASLYAWRFDPARGRLTGQAVPIAPEKLSYWEAKNFVPFTASNDGTLVFLPEVSASTEMRWFDRDGRPLEILGSAGINLTPRISPDGTRVAYMRQESAQSQGDLWVRDLRYDRAVRVTQRSGSYSLPQWSPDSETIIFLCQPKGVPDLCLKSMHDGGEPRVLHESASWKTSGSWLPGRKAVLFAEQDPETNQDIKLLPVDPKGEVTIVVRTPFDEGSPEISPDGLWLAYISDQTGRQEIYVRALEGRSEQWQISNEGGVVARWSRDGKALYYASSDGRLIEVAVQTSPEFRPGTTRLLFKLPALPTETSTVFEDVTPDGRRFLVSVPTESQGRVGFYVTANWTSLMSAGLHD